MLPEKYNKAPSARYAFRFFAAAVAAMILIFVGIAADAAVKQKGFATPEEAVKAFAAALKSNDETELLSIFGTGCKRADIVRGPCQGQTAAGDVYQRL